MQTAPEQHAAQLMIRLWRACQRLPEFGGNLWGRGIAVIERKTGTTFYLSKFEPEGVQEAEAPTMQVTLEVTNYEYRAH